MGQMNPELNFFSSGGEDHTAQHQSNRAPKRQEHGGNRSNGSARTGLYKARPMTSERRTTGNPSRRPGKEKVPWCTASALKTAETRDGAGLVTSRVPKQTRGTTTMRGEAAGSPWTPTKAACRRGLHCPARRPAHFPARQCPCPCLCERAASRRGWSRRVSASRVSPGSPVEDLTPPAWWVGSLPCLSLDGAYTHP